MDAGRELLDICYILAIGFTSLCLMGFIEWLHRRGFVGLPDKFDDYIFRNRMSWFLTTKEEQKRELLDRLEEIRKRIEALE